ncbi:ABC transporter permease [Paraclostridium benzoelyticum]|uniref:ABC transporter permease n=1 Tax=Paraclostridium benzoelyticum TaxID=1629550 RepID=UPI0031CD5B43
MINNYKSVSNRYLKYNKKRTQLMIIGVILSIALISSIGTFLITLQNSFVQEEVNLNGNYHIILENIDKEKFEKIKNNPQIEFISPEKKIVYDNFVGNKKINVKSGNKSLFNIENIQIKEGRLPEKNNEIVIESWILKYFKKPINIGDKLKIDKKEYILSGIANDKWDSKATGITNGYTLDSNVEKDIKNLPIYIKIKDNANKRHVINDITKLVGKNNIAENDTLLKFTGESKDKSMNVALFGIGSIVVGIVVMATIMLIYNAFNISIAERIKQFGQLKAMGATKNQIRTLVLREATTIIIIAIPIGIFLGIISIFGILGIFKSFTREVDIKFIISPIVIIGSMVIGATSVYISALLPAIKVSKISPLVAISSSSSISKEKIKKSRRKYKLNNKLKVNQIMAIKNIKRNKKRFYITSMSMAMSVILFISFISFAKYAGNFTKKITEENKMSFRIVQNQEGIEKNSIDENMLKSIEKLSDIGNVYSNYTPIKLKAVVDESVIPKIIKDQNYTFINNVKYENKDYKYLSVLMNAFDKNKLETLNSYVSSGSIGSLKENEIIVVKNEKMPKGILSPVMNLKVGDEIKIDPKYFYKKEILTPEQYMEGVQPKVEENAKNIYAEDQLITLKVGAVIDDAPYYLGTSGIQKIILPTENLKSIIKDNDVAKSQFNRESVGIKCDSKNTDKVEKELNSFIKTYPDFNVENVEDLNRAAMAYELLPIILLLGFTVVITLISSINIINTISTNITIRTKELASLKAIGMTSKELKSMICLEGMCFGIYGGIIGSIVGTILSYIIYLRFSEIKGFAYNIPYIEIIVAIVGVIVIGYISALIPMKKLRKSNIIEAIKEN